MEASNLRASGTRLSLDINKQTITADFSKWPEFVKRIGGQDQIQFAVLHSQDMLRFPQDVFVPVDDFVELARRQSFFKSTLAALTKNQI